MNFNIILSLAFATWFVGCANNDSADVGTHVSDDLTLQQDGQLQILLQRGLDKLHSDGVVGAIARVNDGGHRTEARTGRARLDGAEPVPFESYFRMGSNTKTFVAVIILQLVDEGKVRLEDTVDRWLPGVVSGHGNDGKKITIRHLLQHTSGLYNYTEALGDTVEDYYATRFKHVEPEELVAMAVGHEPNFAPGTNWSYCNTNYILAGMIIEKVTGRAWSAEVGRRILRPLQMQDTFDPGDWPDLPAPHAQSYVEFSVGKSLVDVTLYNTSTATSAGSLITTTEDLTRFWLGLQSGKLLSPARMTDMHDTSASFGNGYGLGVFWTPTRCGGYWSHGGSVSGFWTRNAVNEDGTRAIVLSENTISDVPGVKEARMKDEARLLEDVMCTGQ